MILCILFFIISIYQILFIFFNSDNCFYRYLSFFSLVSIILIAIGMFHLNLLFKLEIGYLIFTIIGINSNIYYSLNKAKNHYEII